MSYKVLVTFLGVCGCVYVGMWVCVGMYVGVCVCMYVCVGMCVGLWAYKKNTRWRK